MALSRARLALLAAFLGIVAVRGVIAVFTQHQVLPALITLGGAAGCVYFARLAANRSSPALVQGYKRDTVTSDFIALGGVATVVVLVYRLVR